MMSRTLINKADALALTGDYQGAEKAFNDVNSPSKKIKVIGLIHLADMYMRIGNEDKLDKIIVDIEPLLAGLDGETEKEEFYKGRHLLAIKAWKKGSPKKAEAMLNKLITEVSSLYDYKLEGKAIYHDIYRSLAACEFKMGRTGEALTKLN